MDLFASIPDEIILQIALFESIESNNKLCLISRRFNDIICNSNYFWRQRFIKDFGLPENISNITSWKIEYQNYGGDVYTFGINDFGQLGLGDTVQRTVPTRVPNIRAKTVSCGFNYTMIIDVNNNVWAFGSGARKVPTLLHNITAKAVACGAHHTIIIDLKDNVLAFGMNDTGQLGLGDNNRHVLTQIPNIKAKSVSCGNWHTIIIDLNNNVWAFGYNHHGQLGLGDTQDRNIPMLIPNIKAKAVSCGEQHTVVIDLNNNARAFGSNHYGELGLSANSEKQLNPVQISNVKVKSVSCGDHHTMIIDFNNSVWACGWNDFGQLGLGDTRHRNIPTLLPNIKAEFISCRGGRTMIIDLDNNVWAFGNNYNRELGLGDIKDERIPVPTKISNFKAKFVSCGETHTILISTTRTRVISYDEAIQKLNNGDFIPEYQFALIQENQIATFYGTDGNIYLVKLRYDQTSGHILPPI